MFVNIKINFTTPLLFIYTADFSHKKRAVAGSLFLCSFLFSCLLFDGFLICRFFIFLNILALVINFLQAADDFFQIIHHLSQFGAGSRCLGSEMIVFAALH